jgi:hypothetical protein
VGRVVLIGQRGQRSQFDSHVLATDLIRHKTGFQIPCFCTIAIIMLSTSPMPTYGHTNRKKNPHHAECACGAYMIGVSSDEPQLWPHSDTSRSHSFRSCTEAHNLGSFDAAKRNVSFSAFLSSSPTQLDCCAAPHRLYLVGHRRRRRSHRYEERGSTRVLFKKSLRLSLWWLMFPRSNLELTHGG